MGEEENIDIETKKKKFVTLWSICHKSIQLEGAERYNTEVPCFGRSEERRVGKEC